MVDTVHKLPFKSNTPAELTRRPLQNLRREVDRLFDAFDISHGIRPSPATAFPLPRRSYAFT